MRELPQDWSPELRVAAPLADLLALVGELEAVERPRDAFAGAWPHAKVQADGSVDWNAGDLELDADWASRARAQGQSHAWLLAPADIEASAWAGRPAQSLGGCDQLRAVLGEAQERGLAKTEAYLDYADAALAESFAQELSALSQMRRAQGASPSASCDAAREQFAQEQGECERSGGWCDWRPRVFVLERARVGAPQLPADACTSAERDALDEVRRRATLGVAQDLSAAWAQEVDRVASLGYVDARLGEACAARRRRFAPATLLAANARLEGMRATYLAQVPPAVRAGWRAIESEFHVPGAGLHIEFARFSDGRASQTDTRASAADLRSQADALRDYLLSSGRCAGPTGEAPLLSVVVDLRTPAIVDLRPVYPENLACEDLGPLHNFVPAP